MGPSFRFAPSFIAASFALTFAAPALADEPPKEPATSGPRPVTVVLQADEPNARIERQTQVQSYVGLPFKDGSLFSVGTWAPECVAPCAVKLDPRFSYRVGGDGLVPSDSFTLPQNRDRLKVDATMGSTTGRFGGAVLAMGGAAGVLLGGAALIATPILEGQHVGSSAMRSGVLAGGVVVSGAGVIALVSGVWLWLHNDTKLREEQEPTVVSGARVTASGVAF